MNRKGEVTFTTIVKTILAVGVIIILLIFSVRLFSPMFDRGDETAKSYMKILKDEIKVADDGKTGEFYMWWVDGRDGEKNFYLVYFGDAIEAEIEREMYNPAYVPPMYGGVSFERMYVVKNVSFNSFGRKPNRICVCYTEGNKNKGYDATCDYCEDLKHPAVFTGSILVDGTWVEESGDRISIKLEGDKYVFAKIE